MPNPTKKVQIVGEVLKSFVRNDIAQELTEEQQAQVRANIGAIKSEDVTTIVMSLLNDIELITVDDIDAICGVDIQTASDVLF